MNLKNAASTLYLLLVKFHVETDCGKDGLHWHECEMARDELRELDPDRASLLEGLLSGDVIRSK